MLKSADDKFELISDYIKLHIKRKITFNSGLHSIWLGLVWRACMISCHVIVIDMCQD